ncbi:MAG: pitrilysin family protein [Alphaproteobacteria bacterium]
MTVRISLLPNGLRVATDTMGDATSVSLGVFIARGTRNEMPGRDGIAHLLEHMVFKGTTRRRAQQIAEEIENVGGYLDAWTGREQTAYTARVLGEHVPLAIDLIGDMLRNSIFDPAELARERNVVLQEIAESEDDPGDIIFDRLQETAFPNQGLGRPILGRADIVAQLEAMDLRDHLSSHYRVPSMVITAAGKIEHDRFLEDVGTAFADWPTAPLETPPPSHYKGGFYLKDRKLEQAHLALAFSGPSLGDHRRHAGALYALLLGGGMSSRLFQEVREKRGLAYSVHAFLWPYSDTGLFGMYLGVAPNRAHEAIGVALDCMASSINHINVEELSRAKAQAKASLLMGKESTMQRCDALAYQLLVWNRTFSLEEQVADLNSVTINDIHTLGKSMLTAPPSFAAIGTKTKIGSLTGLFEKFP